MVFKKQTRLQILFWEMKTRFVYLIFSFFLSFAIAYSKAQALLYVFAFPTITSSSLSSFNFYDMLNICIFVVGENDQLVQLFGDNFFLESKQLIFKDQVDSIESVENAQPPVSFVDGKRVRENLSLLLNFSLFLNSLNLSSIDFIFTSVDEAFRIQVQLSFFLACFSVVFLLLYESYSFFAPSLYFYESNKWISRLAVISLIWCCFQYNVFSFLIPKLVGFLLSFEHTSSIFNLRAETKVSCYFLWANNILFVSNCVFLFAIVAFFWGKRKASISCKLLTSTSTSTSTNRRFVRRFVSAFAKRLPTRFVAAQPSPKGIRFVLQTRSSVRTRGSNSIALEPSLARRKIGRIIHSLSKHRKTSVIVMMLFSALIAPPDVIQLFLFTLFFLLFELFLFCIALTLHRGQKQVLS